VMNEEIGRDILFKENIAMTAPEICMSTDIARIIFIESLSLYTILSS
jgi:hypothetical protein